MGYSVQMEVDVYGKQQQDLIEILCNLIIQVNSTCHETHADQVLCVQKAAMLYQCSNLDGSVKALQALSGDAIVCEMAPVSPIVTIVLQKDDESFADSDVIRRGVVVQLLMPVLQMHKRCSCTLLDLICHSLVAMRVARIKYNICTLMVQHALQ